MARSVMSALRAGGFHAVDVARPRAVSDIVATTTAASEETQQSQFC